MLLIVYFAPHQIFNLKYINRVARMGNGLMGFIAFSHEDYVFILPGETRLAAFCAQGSSQLSRTKTASS